MPRKAFAAPDAPEPVGPYSAGIEAGGLVFLSGQVPLDQAGKIAGYSTLEQVRKTLENMKAQLAAAGLGMDAVVKTTIYLADLDDFGVVNEIYAEYFDPPYPARSTVQVAGLPKGVKIEIEAIATRE